VLLSDVDQTVGTAYLSVRTPDMPYHDLGIPQRISYLIDPDGVIAEAYDLEGADLGEHSAQVLADIAARS
jgi:peroxiredoxin